MKTTIILLLSLIFCFCQRLPSSTFVNECNSSYYDLSNGVKRSSSDKRLSIIVPDRDWPIFQTKNGFVIGDTSIGYINAISIYEDTYEGKWDWDKETKELLNELFDDPRIEVKEKKKIQFRNTEALEVLLFEDDDQNPKMATLTIFFINNEIKRNYVYSVSVEADSSFQNHICRLKPIFESLEIKKN